MSSADYVSTKRIYEIIGCTFRLVVLVTIHKKSKRFFCFSPNSSLACFTICYNLNHLRKPGINLRPLRVCVQTHAFSKLLMSHRRCWHSHFYVAHLVCSIDVCLGSNQGSSCLHTPALHSSMQGCAVILKSEGAVREGGCECGGCWTSTQGVQLPTRIRMVVYWFEFKVHPAAADHAAYLLHAVIQYPQIVYKIRVYKRVFINTKISK